MSTPPLRACIIAQGDEIVRGATQDTNSVSLAASLSARGVLVTGHISVRDDAREIAEALASAAQDVELLICSGGLGPTDDDLTALAVGRAAALPLVESPLALQQIADRYAALGRPMPSSNRKQALLPLGATLLENPAGTAPGFALDLRRARAFFFPGVPHELDVMTELYLWPWLAARGLSAPLTRRLHVCGVGESELQDRLQRIPLPPSVRLGYKAWAPYNTIVLYGDAARQGELDSVTVQVQQRLGVDCFGEDDDSLAMALGRLLRERGLTLAVAESCTGGGIGAMLTSAPGSSDWFLGGVIAYANTIKQRQLAVPTEVLETQGAVSEACAASMAEGARRALGADVGLATTGIAGPAGGTTDKPVGTVCFGLALEAGTRARTVRFGDRGREHVRSLAVATAVEWLRRHLIKRGAARH